MYYRRSCIMPGNILTHHRVIVNFGTAGTMQSDEILHEKQIRSYEFAAMLEQGFKSGVIDPRTDKEAAWFVYHAVAKALIDNFLAPDVNADSHETFINAVLSLLEQGLRPRSE